jgi:amino acid transporter
MTATSGPSQTAEMADSGGSLRSESLSLFSVSSMGMAYMGLAASAFFVIPYMIEDNGNGVSFVFIITLLAALPSAISFAEMNKQRPSAGSAYTWLWESTWPVIGVWLGFMMLALYGFVSMTANPLVNGEVFDSLLNLLGIGTAYGTAILGGLLALAIVAFMNFRGVSISAKGVAVMFGIEFVFCMLFTLYVVIKNGSHLSATPLLPSGDKNGFAGFKTALIFGLFSIAGFDGIAPVAEETKAPKKVIPRATILVTVFAALCWIWVGYGMDVGATTHQWVGYISSATQAGPYYLFAAHYSAVAKVLVVVVSISAELGVFAAVMVFGSRILYSMARHGEAPAIFAKVNKRTGIPTNAQWALVAMAVVIPIVESLWQGHNVVNAYAWIGNVFVFFALALYLMVNIANVVFHLRNRELFNFWRNLAVPVLGAAIIVWLYVEGFFKTFLPLPFKTGSSIVWFSLLYTVLAMAAAVVVVRRKKARGGYAVRGDADETRPLLGGDLAGSPS